MTNVQRKCYALFIRFLKDNDLLLKFRNCLLKNYGTNFYSFSTSRKIITIKDIFEYENSFSCVIIKSIVVSDNDYRMWVEKHREWKKFLHCEWKNFLHFNNF